MKKFTNSIKVLALLLLIMSSKLAMAQCAANFTYAVNANGNVTFSSTSIPGNSITTVYYWSYGNGSPTFTATGSAGMFPNTTYTSNGSYVVNLFILSSAPSCSSGISYTVNVNTVNSGTCNLLANFNISQGSNGLVNFNNTTTGTVSSTTYFWNFGNGNTSTSSFPSTTYTANGTYIATLTANNNFSASCVSTKTLLINVNSNCNLNLSQTFTTNGNGSYTFTWSPGANSGNYSYSINWGNGNTGTGVGSSGNSFFQTQNYTNGTYTITAIITASAIPGCSSSITQTITVTSGGGCNLIANFSSSHGSNALVNFNNSSTGTNSITTYSWNFGNGNTSTSNSPANTYTANGSYTVTLFATNNTTPTCASTKTAVIFVNSICNLVAGFTYSSGANGLINFYNTTTNTNSFVTYSWNFGSAPSSTVSNPSHIYANGTYTVILTASSFSPNCSDTTAQVIIVSNNTCVANSNFTLTPSGTPKLWNAIPAASANITAAQWSWGDGSVSNTLYTSHLYSVAATYTICLSTTISCGASSSYCSSYYVYKGNGQTDEMIEVNVLDPSNTVGLKNFNSDEINTIIYPNPNSGEFSIQMNGLKDGLIKVGVYNLMGQLISESSSDVKGETLTKEINLQDLSNGVYLVKISSNANTVIKTISVQK